MAAPTFGSLSLGQIAFPLRHERPYGAASACFVFLVAATEFEALLYGLTALAGARLPVLLFAESMLPAAYVVAAAAGGLMFFATRGRSAKIMCAREWTEPVDLETLRQRTAIGGPPDESPEARTRTRQLLDEYRRASGASTGYGVAGAARRR